MIWFDCNIFRGIDRSACTSQPRAAAVNLFTHLPSAVNLFTHLPSAVNLFTHVALRRRALKLPVMMSSAAATADTRPMTRTLPGRMFLPLARSREPIPRKRHFLSHQKFNGLYKISRESSVRETNYVKCNRMRARARRPSG